MDGCDSLVWTSPAPSSWQCVPHTYTQTDLLRNHLKNGLTERLKRFATFTNSIARRTDRSFSRALMRRGHRGRIKFLHNEQKMKIEVQLPGVDDATVADATVAVSCTTEPWSRVCCLRGTDDAGCCQQELSDVAAHHDTGHVWTQRRRAFLYSSGNFPYFTPFGWLSRHRTLTAAELLAAGDACGPNPCK